MRHNIFINLSIFIFMITWNMVAFGNSECENSFFLSFRTFERIDSPSEIRNISVNIHVNSNDNWAEYSYKEIVLGSKMKEVEINNFSFSKKVTDHDIHQIENKIRDIGFFSLSSNEEILPDFSWTINARSGCLENNIINSVRPNKGIFNNLFSIIFKFGESIKVNPINKKEISVKSAGDFGKPDSVSFADLLYDSKKYDGRKISICGFYRRELENSGLYPNELSANGISRSKTIYIGKPSLFSNPDVVEKKHNSWLCVEGIFFKNGNKKFNPYFGKILRITRIFSFQPGMVRKK